MRQRFRAVLEQGRAKRRRQRQRHQCREHHGQHQGNGKLAIDRTGRTRKERHRDEHRHQHQRNRDDRADDLIHRLARRIARRQTFRGHDALDVFHHHDRIVHHDADGQHHGKQGQHVDGITQQIQTDQCPHQGDRNDDGRDQGRTPIGQKQIHHQHHQRQRFGQALHHFFDGNIDKLGGVIRHCPVDAFGKEPGQFRHPGIDRLDGIQGISPR